MKKEYLTPDPKGYLSPLSIELPMETEECIALSNYNEEPWDDEGDYYED